MPRRLALIVGFLFVAGFVGCAEIQVPDHGDAAIEPPGRADPTHAPALVPSRNALRDPAPTGGRAPRASGWLAYIGGDGNVYVTTADRSSTIQITSDATALPEKSGLSYHRLAWSRDNQLAFAAVTRSGSRGHGKLYVAGPMDMPTAAGPTKPWPPRLVAENEEHFIIYSFWSPAGHIDCGVDSACGRLAYLTEETDGVGLHLLSFDSAEVTDRLLDVGRPFYFSWSRDGRFLLWHTGGATRHNPEAEIRLLDLDDVFGYEPAVVGSYPSVPVEPGLFHAPAWAPDRHQWLAVAAEGDTDRLLRFAAPAGTAAGVGKAGAGVGGHTCCAGVQVQFVQDTVVTRVLDRRIAFAWSPDGSRIAYAVQKQRDDTFYGPVHVWESRGDGLTGEVHSLTNPAFDVAGFFWSPDGQRLAYLSRLQLPDEVWMQWRTYDVDRQVDLGFAAFHPAPLMEFMIHSFNQYAQSHSFWSPDGRYLVYADRDRRLVDRVWLVDTVLGDKPTTTGEDSRDPILVDEGSLGVWSWGPVE